MQASSFPYQKESFLHQEECARLVQIIQQNARKDHGCRPVVCTEKRTIVAARSLYGLGFHAEAELLENIRTRCMLEIERNLSPRAPIYPAYMLLQGNYRGDSHIRHADNCRYDQTAGKWVPNHTPDRIFSCGVYLNQCGVDFTGGELVFPTLGKSILPAPGLLVAFPSDERCEHEVPRIESGSRYSIFLWCTDKAASAEHSLVPRLSKREASQSLLPKQEQEATAPLTNPT